MSPEATGYAKIIHLLQVAMMIPRGALSLLTFVSHLASPEHTCLALFEMPSSVQDLKMELAHMTHGQRPSRILQTMASSSKYLCLHNQTLPTTPLRSQMHQLIVHKWLYIPTALNFVKPALFIFLSLRLNHRLRRKAEFPDMAAFWCHRQVPIEDPSRLARVEFTPTDSCLTAPWELTWDPPAHSMLTRGTTRVLSGYYWEESFPPFHLLCTQIQKIWKTATWCKNPLSRVQRNTRISTSAWAKPTLTFRIRDRVYRKIWGWYQLVGLNWLLTPLWRVDEREESREDAEQPSLLALHKTQEVGFIFYMRGRGTGHFIRKGWSWQEFVFIFHLK